MGGKTHPNNIETPQENPEINGIGRHIAVTHTRPSGIAHLS